MRLRPLFPSVLIYFCTATHRSISSNKIMASFTTKRQVLLVSSSVDTASVNIATALKEKISWSQPIAELPLFLGPSDTIDELWLWMQNDPLLLLNHPDQLVRQELQQHGFPQEVCFQEVLFLSKHAAASGKASLTVHPIGVPWVGGTDSGPYGGIPGRCSPPSPRIAPLYRALVQRHAVRAASMKKELTTTVATSSATDGLTSSDSLASNMEVLESNLSNMNMVSFDVTMEATHHGPHVDLPTCFIEIGSTENEWGILDLGRFWADLLYEHFREWDGNPLKPPQAPPPSPPPSPQLDSSSSDNSNVVVMSIGGGHYVPKMNDAARLGEGLHIGHALASYTLQEHLDSTAAVPVTGGWSAIVKEAIHSTRITHPTANLIVLVDKKAFGAEHRRVITGLLDEMGVAWSHQASDVKKLYETTRPV